MNCELTLSVLDVPITGRDADPQHACLTDQFAIDRWTNEGGALSTTKMLSRRIVGDDDSNLSRVGRTVGGSSGQNDHIGFVTVDLPVRKEGVSWVGFVPRDDDCNSTQHERFLDAGKVRSGCSVEVDT